MLTVLLQVTKQSYRDVRLGIGVAVVLNKWPWGLRSEFELLSIDAFDTLGVYQSVNGTPFQHWLPVPISKAHWRQISTPRDGATSVYTAIGQLQRRPGIKGNKADVVITLLHDVLVQMNEDTVSQSDDFDGLDNPKKSTPRHVSTKAVEGIFHLFHLLICLTIESTTIVKKANKMIRGFMEGKTSKYVPAAIVAKIHPEYPVATKQQTANTLAGPTFPTSFTC